MQRITALLRLVPDDPSLELYTASQVGTMLAAERSDRTDMIAMKRFDLHRIWRPQRRLWTLGMPKLSGYEADIIDVLLLSGRPDDEGFLSWTAMRPGQATVIRSLAHETCAHRPHVTTALNRLIKDGLVQRSKLGDRESVRLTEAFHRMMFEAEWRNRLRNTAPKVFDNIITRKGWRWLLYYADEWFRVSDPRKTENRRAVLQELARRAGET